MQEAMKNALDRIIVKNNARMQQIIDWYLANQDYLESQPFRMPFRQALVCLQEESIEFSFEALSDTEVLMKVYLVPDGREVFMCAFKYDTERDIITEKRWPKLAEGPLTMLKAMEVTDKTTKKQAFKYRVLMYYAAYYHNEVVVDVKQEKRLDKHSRASLKKKGMKIPLVRNTYILEPTEDSLKKPADPDKKRNYTKPDHEVAVRGYRRKNGTWVNGYSKYKDKSKGDPKTYKA